MPTQVYQDISFLADKFGLSLKRLNKIIKWIESSRKIKVKNNENYSIPIPQPDNLDCLSYVYNQDAIAIIEESIYLYSQRHPLLKIKNPSRWDAAPSGLPDCLANGSCLNGKVP